MIRRLLVPTIGLTLVIAGAAAAQRPGEAQQEERAIGLFRAIKSEIPDSVVGYLERNLAPESWARRDADAWRETAGRLIDRLSEFELGGVVIPQPGRLRLLLESADGGEMMLGFAFESDPPHRIVELGMSAGGASDGGPPLPPLDVSTAREIDDAASMIEQWVRQLAAADRFSGTILVAHDGTEIFSAAYGLASKRYGVPNTLDTRFDLGSINKSFTRVAIGQLLQAGKLALRDRMGDHLPDYPNQDVARRITIEQLLEHTSGLGDIFTERYRQSSRDLYRTPQDYFPLFADEPLLFEPGQGRQYSNAGYIVLGAIIEAVSGQPYDQYVIEHIFAPAGMSRSGFFARDMPVQDVAEGYTRWSGGGPESQRRSNVFHLPVKGNGAGSAQSTVRDLHKFDEALRTHVLLEPTYTAWYFGDDHPTSSEGDASRAMGHLGIAGGGPGVAALLESDGNLVVAVLSNYDPPTGERMGLEIFRSLRTMLER